MNRRTFLKSTALSLLPPTLLLKGEESLKPLQWTPFSQKLPPKKELIIIAEKYISNPAHFKDCTIGVKLGNKYPQFIIYNIGSMENELHIGSVFFTDDDNKKTEKKEYLILKRLNDKLKPYKYQINENLCYWISITDLLKHTKNIPINKSNMNIVAVKQYDVCCEIFVGKIINVNEQDIEVDTTIKHSVNTNKYPNKTWLYQNSMNFKKNDIIQWTELPNLPINSMAI